MRQVETTNTNSITIQRVGGLAVAVPIGEDTTVAQALVIAGISLAGSESIYYNGESVENIEAAILDNGDALQIVQNKKGGNR
jgi:hypothetical protein